MLVGFLPSIFHANEEKKNAHVSVHMSVAFHAANVFLQVQGGKKKQKNTQEKNKKKQKDAA